MSGLFSWFKKSSDSEVVALFHVGSASVSVGLAEVGAQKPTLFFSKREVLPYQQELDFPRLLQATTATLEVLGNALLHEGVLEYQKYTGKAPYIRRVLVVLSSPWYVSKTIELSIQKEQPTLVTEAVIADMVKTVKTKLERDLEAGALPAIGKDAMLLEESLTTVFLDGYPIDQPFGKKAKHVKAALFLSFIGSDLRDLFSTALSRTIHTYTTRLYSFVLTAFTLLRDLYPKSHTFLLMDVDGEVTDVSLIKDSVLVETISFPCGKYSVLRCLGEEAGPQEARVSLLKTNATGHAGVRKAKEEWLSQYRTALEGLAEHSAIPNELFITTQADVLPWFQEVIEGYEGGSGIFSRPRKVIPITENFFLSHLEIKGGAHYDIYLAFLLLFFNKERRVQG